MTSDDLWVVVQELPVGFRLDTDELYLDSVVALVAARHRNSSQQTSAFSAVTLTAYIALIEGIKS